MPQVFMSYSRSDAAFARRLTDSLREAGGDVWIDVSDIRSGDDWSDAIQHALDECTVMILLLSPESMDSVNVASEWKYYLDEGKTVIPVLLREARVHFRLKPLNYIDFSKQEYDAGLAQLRAELERKGVVFAASGQTITAEQDTATPASEGRSVRTLAIVVAIAVLFLAALVLAASTLIDFDGDNDRREDDLSPQEIAQTLVAERDATQTAEAALAPVDEIPPAMEGNLLANPGFEGPFENIGGDTTLQLAAGWQPWYLTETVTQQNIRPVYQPAAAEWVLSGSASQAYSVTDAMPAGGVYQTVAVTPGVLFKFSILAAAAAGTDVQVSVGIDPEGGTDSNGSEVVWSAPTPLADATADLSVQARSAGTMVTVFVRTESAPAAANSTLILDDASLIALDEP